MNNYLLALVALLPIVFLMVALGVYRVPAHKACSIALVFTVLLAVFVWKMGIALAGLAVLEGALLGLWPIRKSDIVSLQGPCKHPFPNLIKHYLKQYIISMTTVPINRYMKI